MRRLLACTLLVALPAAASACDRPVCEVPPDSLRLARIVTFEGLPSGPGPGRPVDGLLDLDGVAFGERFAGQSSRAAATFDRIDGPASAPLVLLPGPEWHNLSVMRLPEANVLSGDGPAGYPRVEASGEGAVAVLFAADQVALRLRLRGGEGGTAEVRFLRRDGVEIDRHVLGPLAEGQFAFERGDQLGDIAGLLITNHDPEGIALQSVEFEGAATIGWLRDRSGASPG